MTSTLTPTAAPPTVMRAVRFDCAGAPDVMSVRRVPVPQPQAHELLVRVHASGLNPKDALFRERTPGRAPFPRGVGFDFAGVVSVAGRDVHDLAAGDAIWGFLDGVAGGAVAEFVTVPRAWLSRMPTSLPFDEAATLPLAGSAALQALRDIAHVQPGERVLIKGASGGVGSAAIQIARALGAEVTAVVRPDAATYVRALGAHHVCSVDDVRTMPARSVDVLVDCAGNSAYRAHRRLFARAGRWVTIAPNPVVYVLSPLSRVLTMLVDGPTMGYVVVRPRAADLAWLAALSDAGRLRMPIVARYAMGEIADAHRALSERGTLGKRVVTLAEQAP
jgi:NADPH:quinone reductase-like Zn-dependent oxidoreductase